MPFTRSNISATVFLINIFLQKIVFYILIKRHNVLKVIRCRNKSARNASSLYLISFKSKSHNTALKTLDWNFWNCIS